MIWKYWRAAGAYCVTAIPCWCHLLAALISGGLLVKVCTLKTWKFMFSQFLVRVFLGKWAGREKYRSFFFPFYNLTKPEDDTRQLLSKERKLYVLHIFYLCLWVKVDEGHEHLYVLLFSGELSQGEQEVTCPAGSACYPLSPSVHRPPPQRTRCFGLWVASSLVSYIAGCHWLYLYLCLFHGSRKKSLLPTNGTYFLPK